MKAWLLAAAALASFEAAAAGVLAAKSWIHGSRDCADNTDPAIEVYRHDADTFILRQNKCLDFEAPFIYVLFGRHTVFVLDTGATGDAREFPLYDTVEQLAAERSGPMAAVVAHSHSHGDHVAADAQFRGKPGVVLVEPEGPAVRKHFGLVSWPGGAATVDLGDRTLTILPAPGHQDEAIVVHDSRTGWLLTGDTLLPGRLYVRHWKQYRRSIARLAEFARANPVSAVLGAHIEMSAAGKLFDAGSTFQPGEASLVLTTADLLELNRLLDKAGNEPREIVTPRFVVVPIGWFGRTVSTVLSWFGVR